RGRGAELGHIIVQAEGGYPCGCGGRGCLEAHASVKALAEDYQRGLRPALSEEIDGRLIVARYLDGEPLAVEAMNRHFDWLAAGVAGLINIFSPQKVVIGGGISEGGDFYIREIRRRALSRAMKETSLNTAIEAAQLGNKAGLLGAAAQVFTAGPT
ncbi:MAG: ROK family protein, partial [Bacteroidetes bacterium]|nr:ROK family protein [Bacteroidota bacterium]